MYLYQRIYKVGWLGYLAYFILAFVFYKERTIFMDAAYHLFFIIATDDFAIQNHRFGAAVTQVFPLLARKAGISLNNILIIYSLGVAFYYALCYYICGTILKQYGLALVLLLFNTLLATDTFFWMHSELPQGCVLLLVVFALIKNTVETERLRVMKHLLISVLLTVVGFFHPLIIFPAIFLFLYFILSGSYKNKKPFFIVYLVFYLFIYYIKFQFYKTPYDETATGYSENFLHKLPDYFDLNSSRIFLKDLGGKFTWITIFFITTVAYYLFQRKWLYLILYISFIIGYIVLINTSYYLPGITAFYMENMYLPIAIFLAVPLIFEIGNRHIPFKVFAAILLLVISSFIARIIYIGSFYSDRLNWERTYLEQHLDEKLILHERYAPKEKLLLSWGTSYEFWLLSTVEHKKSASLLFTDDFKDVIPPAGKTKSYIMRYHGFPYQILPEQYFIFDDTVTEYKVIR